MSVGKKIADIIEQKGLTQKEVAEKAGIKPQTLNNIITRDSSRADVQIFLKICDALDVPVAIFRDEALEEFYQDHPNAERIDDDYPNSPLYDFTENERQNARNTIGNRIRKRREQLAMTQTQLEKATGIGHRMISNYEKGISKPNDEIIKTLMAALNCDANYLFGFSDSVESEILNKKSPLSELSENEQQIVGLFRQLNETQQGELIGRAKVMAEQNDESCKQDDVV